jgi:hypothetical protein
VLTAITWAIKYCIHNMMQSIKFINWEKLWKSWMSTGLPVDLFQAENLTRDFVKTIFRPDVTKEDHGLLSQNRHYPIQYLNHVPQTHCYCCLVAIREELAFLYITVAFSLECVGAITKTFRISDFDKDLNRIWNRMVTPWHVLIPAMFREFPCFSWLSRYSRQVVSYAKSKYF